MAAKGDFGRVYFPGNPWPKGHQIVECFWSGRIERSTGVWFDFHIVSEPFDIADKGRRFPDEDDNLNPTESRVLWCNHHHMIFSTTNWPGLAYGFQAGSREEPFDYRKLSGSTFRVEDPPLFEGYPRSLAIYRWGHESVAYSSVAFKKESGSKTFSIHWSGRVGGFSRGIPDFPYQFNMKLKKVAFAGIYLPVHIERSDAFAIAEPYVQDARKYKFQRRKNETVLLPP